MSSTSTGFPFQLIRLSTKVIHRNTNMFGKTSIKRPRIFRYSLAPSNAHCLLVGKLAGIGDVPQQHSGLDSSVSLFVGMGTTPIYRDFKHPALEQCSRLARLFSLYHLRPPRHRTHCPWGPYLVY